MGVFNQNEITNDYLTTNNKGYGKPLLNNNLDSLVYEQNLQSTYNTAKSVKKEETSLFGDLNDNSKLAGKKQFDRLKIDQNVFNNNNQPIENVFANPFGKKQYQDKSKLEYNVVNPTSEILGNNSFGKKQFQDNKLKADFNVLNNGTYDLNKEFILNEIGKKKFHEKAKADFNVISGKKNEEGKYVSAKQEFQLDTKGEEFFKKKLTENSNNLANLFAGLFFSKPAFFNYI